MHRGCRFCCRSPTFRVQAKRRPVRFHAACGSELAHAEAGANAENLPISQSAFASKLAPTEGTQSRVGVSLLTKRPVQTPKVY
ncbi:hypothetical protein B1F85_04295 [Pseudomonas syringae pv. actinidiae]|nr:hypothetical protein B1R35_04295 [Pseudomonas syringae pv. actinidiae]AQX63357.1 hypothetical protein B1F85_04295 [Pseudomonas syringae pv. actinidiae]